MPSVPPALPDAEALYQLLLQYVQQEKNGLLLVGIASGGAWLAERLARDTDLPFGIISSTMHRDDFAKRGLSNSQQTKLPFAIDGADICLIDDVLYTGRTIRAVINELFDYGRPKRVRLAVLVDRNERELPISADFCATKLPVTQGRKLSLEQGANGKLQFSWGA